MEDRLREYRATLLAAGQKAQAEFDKTVFALSGGALAVSFAFVKQFVGPGPALKRWMLTAAWVCWIVSLAAVLASHYFSALALRKAVRQTDKAKIDVERPGGSYDVAVGVLNALGGIGFLVGVLFTIFFVTANVR